LRQEGKEELTLQCHDIATGALHHLRNHVVDESVLIPDLLLLKLLRIRALIDLLEDVLEPPIILLQNRVLGAHIQRQALAQRQLETRVCEAGNRFVGVVLSLRYATGLEVEHFDFFGLAAFGSVDHGELARTFDDEVFGAVLVAEGVAADDDGLFPAGDETRDAGDDDGFAEDGAAEDVTDGAIGGQPH
jgi:hypothetical protein